VRYLAVLAIVAGCSGPPTRSPTTGGSGSPGPGSGSAGSKMSRFPTTSGEVRIVVTGKAITMNGTKISGTPMVADIEAVYGKPDRTWDSGGANKVHTWDQIGLLVYEPYGGGGGGGDGRCISATFPYKPMTPSFTPKNLFSGTIVLDGNSFVSSLALATVKSWKGATQPYSPSSIVFDRDDFHVFTIEETKGTSLDLVELSFWQKGRMDRPTKKPPPTPRVVLDEAEDKCKAGDAPRCTSLALAYQTGAKGRKNVERSYEMAKLACAGGDPFGCLMMGNMLDAGRGTTKNVAEAKTAWKRACTLGYKAACDLAK
jgi:hypothetical protein